MRLTGGPRPSVERHSCAAGPPYIEKQTQLWTAMLAGTKASAAEPAPADRAFHRGEVAPITPITTT